MGSLPHITVCICTFRRPHLLERLLRELDGEETGGAFTYSIVITDNDRGRSGEKVARDFAAASAVPVTYTVEPERNIALARNRAVAQATGDYVAFIDDDEYPCREWLLELFRTCRETGVDGVLGPVIPYFETDPPAWVIRGRFFERPTHETGYRIGFSDMRTSNVMVRGAILAAAPPFRAEFGNGGEDTDFFMRMRGKGCAFVWCNEAAVYEAVPAERCCRRYLLRRALHSGNTFFKIRAGRLRNVCKSFVALPAYSVALPFLFLAGDHHFMNYLIRLCNHAGRLLALFRIRPFSAYK